MEQVYDWVRNLTGYFLFMAVLENLLPGKKYAKYIRLFAGIVLILLVLQPIAGGVKLEEAAAHYYETFVFQNQAEDLKRELLGVEKQRLDQMIRQYEEAVEHDIVLMAEEEGFAVRECRAVISGEEGTERFGTVTRVMLKAAGREKARQEEEWQEDGDSPDIIQIEPVEIELGKEEAQQTERNGQKEDGVPGEGVRQADRNRQEKVCVPGTEEQWESGDAERQLLRRHQEELRTAAGKLRRRIAAYYDLEDNYVEIQIVEGEG